MFEYKTRTESINGCKFLEPDFIMFDYNYSGDIMMECKIQYNVSGFGIVLAENTDKDISNSDNVLILKFGKLNSYKIISKDSIEQKTEVSSYIDPGANLTIGDILFFRFRKKDDLLKAYLCRELKNEVIEETLLVSYRLRKNMEQYKVGIYSNTGNVLTYATISTEAPSNWTTNVLNANGGRLSFIKDGFTFEDALYDIEAEAQLITLEPGTYYLDYETSNPEIKAYVFAADSQVRDKQRSLEDMVATKDDEIKNILDKDKKFIVPVKGTYNLRFKGKSGTISNICIKTDKNSEFIETDYTTIEKDGSSLKFDLDKIVSIEAEGIITSVPEYELTSVRPYSSFKTDSWSIGLTSDIKLNTTLNILYQNRILTVNGKKLFTFNTNKGQFLWMFDNVNAVITKLIIVNSKGQKIDIILQKTNKITISKNINSPILVTNIDDEPYDLSSSYREVINVYTTIDVFNAKNPIKLTHDIKITSPKIKLFGTNDISSYYQDAATITQYEAISPNFYRLDTLSRVIKLDVTIKNKFNYILAQYEAYDDYEYLYTNWEREIFTTDKSKSFYLNSKPRSGTGNIIIYGIKAINDINTDMLYRVNNVNMVNSIDISTSLYEIIDDEKYLINSTGKLTLDSLTGKKYAILVIDYLKTNNYCINEKDNYYEIDISSNDNECKILYDSKDGNTTEAYQQLNIATPEKGDFIVLEV